MQSNSDRAQRAAMTTAVLAGVLGAGTPALAHDHGAHAAPPGDDAAIQAGGNAHGNGNGNGNGHGRGHVTADTSAPAPPPPSQPAAGETTQAQPAPAASANGNGHAKHHGE